MSHSAAHRLFDDPPSSESEEHILDGVAVAPGIVSGPAFRYMPGMPSVSDDAIAPEAIDEELDMLEQAVQHAEAELTQVIAVAREKLGDDSAAIFDAQRMMLRDDELLGPVRERIREQHDNAAYAVTAVMDTHRQRLEASDNAFFRERASDLTDVQRRLLNALRRDKLVGAVPPHTIVLANTLTASDVLRFKRKGIAGCVTSDGGATSHVSIIARALEMPTLVGVGEDLCSIDAETPLILDGLAGRLVAHPGSNTQALYREEKQRYHALVKEQADTADLPARTQDAVSVHLQANVEFREELSLLERYGADGIGLLRTEMLALVHAEQMRTDQMLAEDVQYRLYRDAAQTTGAAGTTIRLLDLGGDKMMPLAHREENPFLGWRGVRVLLDRPEILRPQVRAVLRANAHGPLRLLIPMVTQPSDLSHVRTVLAEESERLSAQHIEHDADLPVGIMVEVPSVALQASLFAQHADFFSIGTNDLTQYTLAVDRGNDLVAQHYDAFHPAVLMLIQRAVAAARTADIPVSLCGEMASDPHATPLLLGLGLTRLSMPPPYIPAVKRVIRHLDHEATRALATDATTAPDGQAVRRLLRTWMDDHLSTDWSMAACPFPQSSAPSGDGTPDAPFPTLSSSTRFSSPTASASMAASILDRVNDDLKAAMKAQDKVRRRTLRSLRAALKNKQIEKREHGNGDTLSDQEQLAVVRKQVKQRKDSIEQYSEHGRDDLADKEQAEVDVLKDYLPAALSDETLRDILQDIIDDVGASSMADMGPVMGAAMGQLRGRVEGSRVQQMVQDLLS